jgi:hypothetical protein
MKKPRFAGLFFGLRRAGFLAVSPRGGANPRTPAQRKSRESALRESVFVDAALAATRKNPVT